MEKPYLFASTETVLGVSVRALALSVAAGAFKRRVPVISESTLLSLLSPLVQTLDLRLLFERPLLDFLGLHLFAVLFRFARLAALLARRQPRAVLGRVPLLVAVATLVREEQGAAHRAAVLLLLDPVAGELRLRALRVEAEGAELLVRLAADDCH